MMTQERKDQLYDVMFGWICERVDGGKEMYELLHGKFGMSKQELHDHCIESLDEFFPKESVRARFEQKIRNCLSMYEDAWRKLTPDALVEQAESIASFQFMARRSVQLAGEDEMAYLLRFKDPLKVLTDHLNDQIGMNPDEDETVHSVLWEIMDKQDAEQIYEMEPEFSNQAPQQAQTPELTM